MNSFVTRADEAVSSIPAWTSSGDVGGVRVTEDIAGSLVEAGT